MPQNRQAKISVSAPHSDTLPVICRGRRWSDTSLNVLSSVLSNLGTLLVTELGTNTSTTPISACEISTEKKSIQEEVLVKHEWPCAIIYLSWYISGINWIVLLVEGSLAWLGLVILIRPHSLILVCLMVVGIYSKSRKIPNNIRWEALGCKYFSGHCLHHISKCPIGHRKSQDHQAQTQGLWNKFQPSEKEWQRHIAKGTPRDWQ